MYKYKVTYNDGTCCTFRDDVDGVDVISLLRMLDKCDIKRFSVELA